MLFILIMLQPERAHRKPIKLRTPTPEDVEETRHSSHSTHSQPPTNSAANHRVSPIPEQKTPSSTGPKEDANGTVIISHTSQSASLCCVALILVFQSYFFWPKLLFYLLSMPWFTFFKLLVLLSGDIMNVSHFPWAMNTLQNMYSLYPVTVL